MNSKLLEVEARHAEMKKEVGNLSRILNGKPQADIEEPLEPKTLPEPKISEEAFYGLAGEIVRMIEPHTEADSVGLLVSILAEFGVVLKVMSREGNSLSGTIRDAWDGEDLSPMTKGGKSGNRAKATKPHIVIVGHVTQDELLRNLTETESSNGFGNRFAWFYVKRSKKLPFPGSPETSKQNKMVAYLREALSYSEDVDEITLSEGAKDIWRTVYSDLSKDRPGLSGSLLNRSEAYVMRLSAIYALLDCNVIDAPHMLAALSLWEYAIDSVFFIFGNKTGDSVADAILEGIKRAGENGMSDAEINNMFGGHKKASRLNSAKQALKDAGRIVNEVRETDGRTKTVWLLS